MPHTHDVTLESDTVRKAYVSWDEGEADREWAALLHLAEHAPGLAPQPVRRTTHEGRPVVVMSRLPGEPLSGRVTGAVLDGLVAALERLFSVPVPTDLRPRANGPSQADLRGRTAAWLDDPLDLGRCRDAGLVTEAASRARGWLAAPGAHAEVVDPVVALGDGNLDNALWDGRACRLVDWEEFGTSDLAYELADVVEHASARLDRRLDADELLDRFALTPAQAARVEEHRSLFACFWLTMLLPGNRGFERNPEGSVEDQARHVLRRLDGC